ncbi:T cell activation RhoGTPase activating protein b [Synchiropus picturatus]
MDRPQSRITALRRGSYDDAAASLHPRRTTSGGGFSMDRPQSRITALRRGSYDDAAASLRPHFKVLAQRRRSAPSLVFGKAIPWSPISEESCSVSVEQSPFVLGLTSENGPLLLDECVQVTEGAKTRERHLFLFRDVIVVAKLRSPFSYRLKHRVTLSDMCLQSVEEDLDEEEQLWADVDPRVTLVMAWPFTFSLVCFGSPEVKDRWFETLSSQIKVVTARAGTASIPPAVLMKVLSSSVTNKEQSGRGMEAIIQSATDGDAKISSVSKHDQENKPAQAHETKWNLVRRLGKKASFASKAEAAGHKTRLFGLPLHKICPDDCSLPKPVNEMLLLLRKRGPATEGVFRKPCNTKNMRDIREKLNSGQEVDLEGQPVVLLVGLLKSFLKEIPGSLLVSELYEKWMAALDIEDVQQRAVDIGMMVEQLPRCNRLLLQHLLCLLHHILQNADINKMNASNLAVCIGPTLLQLDDTPLEEQKDKMGKVTELTQFLIEHCELLGENLVNLLDTDEDSLCSQHHDSAYDSTDPDGDGEGGDNSSHDGSSWSSSLSPNVAARVSWPSNAVFDMKPVFGRRCSEPIILHSTDSDSLSRSHDDCSVERQPSGQKPLTKPLSDESFLLRHATEPMFPFATLRSTANHPANAQKKDCSSSSLESAMSNQSEESVFTSSPKGSPTCTKRNNQTFSELLPKQNPDAKISSQPMRPIAKVLLRTRSLGRFTRSSLKKEAQNLFPCETLQEDSQSEAEPPAEQRLRPLSAVEVFRQVDSRLPCSPPSYEQAMHNTGLPPQYGSMTVQDAIQLKRRSRPSSVNYEFPCGAHTEPYDAHVVVARQPFRQRAMSESVGPVTRRCSQPVFEEFSYAKESYV